MKRRDFLSLCGLAAGSVLIPAPIARLIRDTCVLGGQPLIVPPQSKNASILYAVYDYGDYTLHFGDPNAEPPVPTWEEFIDSRSVDMNDDEERADFLEQYFGWDRSEGEEEPEVPLNEPIDGGALEHYMEWDFEMRESPMALAYHYLNDLPLCPDTIRRTGDPLGNLSSLGALSLIKQLQSSDPRLVQIHAGVLLGSDAFESGIHEAHELEAGEGFAWVG
jgi:hypothetical protein